MERKVEWKEEYGGFMENKGCGIEKLDGGWEERLGKSIGGDFCEND